MSGDSKDVENLEYWQKKVEDGFGEFYNCKLRIVQMFYGKIGFFQFVESLFGPIIRDDKTKSFNFFFSLKSILWKLVNHDKKKNELNPEKDGVFATKKWTEKELPIQENEY